MEITLLELLKVAKNIEENGYGFYTQLINHAGSQKTKAIFERLAQDEKQHKADFENIISQSTNLIQEKETYADSEDIDAYLSRMLKSDVFKKLEKWADIFQTIKTEKEAIELALKAEHSSIDYYQKLKSYFSEEEVIRILDKIQEEERKHVAALKELL